jgi:succinate dehydrogenase/fumarate reductase flavoprotein subunit
MFASRARNVDLSSGGAGAAGAIARWKAAANQAGDQMRVNEEALASAQAHISELLVASKAQKGKDIEKVKELKEKVKEFKDEDKRSKREISELQEACMWAQERVTQLEATAKVAFKATVQ